MHIYVYLLFFEDRFNSFSEMVAESGVVAFKKSLRMMLAHSFATDCQSAPFLHTELSFDTVLLCCRPMALCRAAKLSYVVYLCSEASSRVSVYFWFLQNRKNSYLGAKGLRSSKKSPRALRRLNPQKSAPPNLNTKRLNSQRLNSQRLNSQRLFL